MKKVKRRSTAALLIAAVILCLMGIYLARLIKDGDEWASFRANDSVYSDWVLNTGTVTDRNGVILARAGDGEQHYNDDETVRRACLHTVGDYEGFIGTGALAVFRERLINYSFFLGTTTGGGEVELSVDSELCATALNALDGQNGAVLICNYQTGEILCSVSAPTYDPTARPEEPESGSYVDSCLSATFVPGSVFKLVTLAAAVESLPELYDMSFYCDGSVTVSGETVTCSGVHGTQGIEDAFANSCNCAFAELALRLGGGTIRDYAIKYGLCSSHDLNGIATAAGSVDAGAADSASTAWEGIGQYHDMVNPYAMLRLVCAVARGGDVREPSILLGAKTDTAELMTPSTAGALASMMAYAVENEYGADTFPGLDIRAKTGTAEVGDGTSHAWFAGYLASGEPLAFVVMIEHGGGGLRAAGSAANTVLQAAVG